MSRLSTGHLVMIVAGLVGMLLTVAVLRGADERQPVAVAARDLAPGTALTESAVRYERVRMDDSLLDTVLQPGDVKRLGGSVAAYPIVAGELIHRRAIRPAAAPAGKRAMSISIDPARAVSGALEAGDRVDVILAGNHEVSIIVADAEVLDVGRPDRGGAFGGVDRKFTVTLAVDARESQLVRGWDCWRRHRHHADHRVPPSRVDASAARRRVARRAKFRALTMPEPEVALVFSPDAWVEGLHRHLTDHGGARVRQVVMDPALAFDEEYGTLVVSHRWPALTRPFVDAIHGRRRRILGVFDPQEPAGHEYLVSIGVDRVLASDASMAEFVDAFTALAPEREQPGPSVTALEAAVDGTPISKPEAHGTRSGLRLIAVGGTPGAGTTELAIAFTAMLSEEGECTLLIDADEVAPSIAQRLGLPIEPNLRSAIESVEYGMGDVDATIVRAARQFDVLCGLPHVGSWSQVRPSEVLDVIEAVARTRRCVVANVASHLEDVGRSGQARYGISRAVVSKASALIGVGIATPVGVTRLLGWITAVRALNPAAPIHLVVNRMPRDAFRKAEVEQEIRRTFQPVSFSCLPYDPRVESAAWSGELVTHGPYAKAVAEIGSRIAPPTRTLTRTRSNARKRPARAPVMAR